MRMTSVCEEDAKDRCKWKLRTRVTDPKSLREEEKEEE